MKKLLLGLALAAGLYWWWQPSSVTVADSDVSFDYLLRVTDAGKGRDRLPMLVALHGNGDTARHFHATALDALSVPARIVLFQGPLRNGSGRGWPGDAAGRQRYGEALRQAVRQLQQEYSTAGQPVLLGFSGGGAMAWYQAGTNDGLFAQVFPVSGRLSAGDLPADTPAGLAPVHAFHGRHDDLISISGGRRAAELLRERGANVEFTEFDGGHLGLFHEMKAQISAAVDEALDRARLGG